MTNLRRTRHALIGLAMLVGCDLVWVLLTRASLLAPTVPLGRVSVAIRLVLVAGIALALAASSTRGLRTRAVSWSVLTAALVASLFQFHFMGPRVVGDGTMYYVYVRSLWKDFDLDFANEYGHYGLLRPDRGDLTTPTSTGLRRSIFSIGPAVLWSPFFGVGEVVARAQRLVDPSVDLSGYGPIHWNAVALGSFAYGFGAVLLVYGFLRRHFVPAIALLAALLMWGATFLHWYMVDQPTYAHAPSAFLAAMAIWLWDRQRDERSWSRYLLWGLCLGLAMCVRWQNGVLLLLPGLELLAQVRRRERSWPLLAANGLCLGVGMAIGAFPQMAAWKVLYDEWLLRYPPHGAGFVRLDHPFLMETFFSSRHGLLSWTPVLWLGYLGMLVALRRRWPTAVPLLLCAGVMTYVNVCAGDWWAGASFSNRRFDSVLPLLAFGMAAALEWLRTASARFPGAAVAVLLLPGVACNVCEVALLQTGRAPRGVTTSFAEQAGRCARAVSDAVGSPPTWPASWIFALRHQVPPSRYDLVSGRYLFYRQNNMGGRIDIGVAAGDALLAEGWGPARMEDGISSRAVASHARLFAPLDVPETLVVRVGARAASEQGGLTLLVNGSLVGAATLGTAWSAPEFRVPRSLWHRETNEIVLETTGAGVAIDAFEFVREQVS